MTEWSNDLMKYRTGKTLEGLEDARILAKSDRWDTCVNRLYYSCFYAVIALLIKNEFSSSKHTGVRSLLNKHFIKTGKIPKDTAKIYNDLFERRQESDYEDFIDFNESQVRPWIAKTELFVNYIIDLVEKKKSDSS